MNDTEAILLDFLMTAQQTLTREDPDWANREEAREALYRAFLTRHAGNHTLIHEINDLLDAAHGEAEYRGDQSFLLGLQMGLDLGCITPLRRVTLAKVHIFS